MSLYSRRFGVVEVRLTATGRNGIVIVDHDWMPEWVEASWEEATDWLTVHGYTLTPTPVVSEWPTEVYLVQKPQEPRRRLRILRR